MDGDSGFARRWTTRGCDDRQRGGRRSRWNQAARPNGGSETRRSTRSWVDHFGRGLQVAADRCHSSATSRVVQRRRWWRTASTTGISSPFLLRLLNLLRPSSFPPYLSLALPASSRFLPPSSLPPLHSLSLFLIRLSFSLPPFPSQPPPRTVYIPYTH